MAASVSPIFSAGPSAQAAAMLPPGNARARPSAANATKPRAYSTPAMTEAYHTTQPTRKATSMFRTFFAYV